MNKRAFARFSSVLAGVLTILCLMLLFAGAGSTQDISRNRILRRIDSNEIARVKGTAHPLARPEADRGRLGPEQQLSHLSITFALSAAQQADLQNLLREQQDRSSPNYHKWLTPEQYAARFGMNDSDLAKVTSWLQSQGLTVEGVSRNRREISFSGSVGQVEYALKTELHNYSSNGEVHFANATDISLPAAFAGEVLGVRGLNSFYPKPKRLRPAPRFTSNTSGNHFVIPGDFATIYDLPSTFDGSGQTIAVVGQTTINTADIDKFRSASGLPARTSSNFQQIQVSGTGTAMKCSGDEGEADLDLEWAAAVAPGATIKYVYAGVGTGGSCSGNQRTANVFDALQDAIENDRAPIISISYGNCEANLPKSFVLTMQGWAQQANAQGQTISGPAGDTGAADCDSGASATNGLQVDVPASIPEVTGVGGTEFNGDAAGAVSGGCGQPTQYWGQGCTPSSPTGTALSYIPEKSWNDVTQSLQQNPPSMDATGGGASTVFGKPSWQTGTGVPADSKRDVPDIALNASDFHDPYLFCSEDFYTGVSTTAVSCANGFRTTDSNTGANSFNNGLTAVGGTSAGAPTFAGVLALVAQATGSNGLGNVNPMLYSLAASTPNAFHDVISGDNKVPCTSGTKNCPSGTTSIGFSAGTGYDQVTGLGSLDVNNLITAWLAAIGANPGGDFTISGLPATAGGTGQNATSTITVSAMNGFTGTVDLTCTASSTKVSCSLNPASVDLSSAGTQTSSMSLTASADLRMPNGRHPRGLWIGAGGGIFAVAILGSVSSRRRWLAIFGLTLLAIAITSVGCGGGSGNNNKNQGPQTYTVTVTGTGTNSGGTGLTHSTTINFTVQ